MNKDIIKMYDLVFQDMVKCRVEELKEEDKKKINEDIINKIAHDMIYNNDYLWEKINETIDEHLWLNIRTEEK